MIDVAAIQPALQQAPLFAGVDPAALTTIVAVAGRRAVRAGAFFYQQDAPAARLYVLALGRVKFTQLTATGQQVLLRLGGPGDIFGAVPILGG